jgi:acetyl esterase/lipase
MSGHFWAIGLGPGQPDLVTPRALAAIEDCDVLYLMSREGTPAYKLVRELTPSKDVRLFLPANLKWGVWGIDPELLRVAEEASEITANGKNAGILILGDPSIYSPFAYLADHLKRKEVEVQVAPGIPFFACASLATRDWLVRDSGNLLIAGSPNLKAIEDAFVSATTVVLYAADQVALRSIRSFALRSGLASARLVRLSDDGHSHLFADLLIEEPPVDGGMIVLRRREDQSFERTKFHIRLTNSETTTGVAREIDGVYRTLLDGTALGFTAFLPEIAEGGAPALILFHGGGWQIGDRSQFRALGRTLSTAGIAVFSCDYRISSKHGTTPFESIADARYMIEWLAENAAQFGVDSTRIVSGGASAGGHIAAAPFIVREQRSDRSQRVPRGFVLFNPVTDTGPGGFGDEIIPGDSADLDLIKRFTEPISPCIVFHGTEDKLVPYTNSVEFAKRAREVGTDVDLHLYPGVPHGFFNFDFNATRRYFYDTSEKIGSFLERLNIVEPGTAGKIKLLNECDRLECLADNASGESELVASFHALRSSLNKMDQDLEEWKLRTGAGTDINRILGNFKELNVKLNRIENLFSYLKL